MSSHKTSAQQRLLWAEGISAFGTAMSVVALPWFVLQTTGSMQLAGIVVAAEIAPIPLLGLAQGRVVARLGVRSTLVLSDVARAALLAAIPALFVLGALPFPALVALVAMFGCFAVPHYSAQRTAIAQLSHTESIAIQINAKFRAALHFAQIAGPVAAAVLVVTIGATSVLAIDAATFLVSAMLLSKLPVQNAASPRNSEPVSMLAGLRAIRASRDLWPYVRAMVSVDVTMAVIAMLGVAAMVRHYDHSAGVVGLAITGYGLGAIFGSRIAARAAQVYRSRSLVLAGMVCYLAAISALLVGGASAPMIIAALALAGLSNPAISATVMARVALQADEAVHPQMFGAVMIVSQTLVPIAFIGAGMLVEAAGVSELLGAILVITTISTVRAACTLSSNVAVRSKGVPAAAVEDAAA